VNAPGQDLSEGGSSAGLPEHEARLSRAGTSRAPALSPDVQGFGESPFKADLELAIVTCASIAQLVRACA
jgi:hypothetical protein